MAATPTGTINLRRDSCRLASLIDEKVSTIRLDGQVLDRAAGQIDRLSSEYSSSLAIIWLGAIQYHKPAAKNE
jgi:hypothetical protein